MLNRIICSKHLSLKPKYKSIMKTQSSTLIRFLAAIFFTGALWSCTKEKTSAPAAASQQSSLSSDDALQAGETLSPTVLPGTYVITNFIDSSVDNTAEFTGYTFDFQADGTLVATTNTSDTFTGRWKVNAAETHMAIKITGTPELDELNSTDWVVIKITDKHISIKKKGPTKVVFTIQ